MLGNINPDHTRHDRQFVVDQVSQNTSSLVFVDITNAILTAKDLEDEGNYDVIFSFMISPSVANTLASFEILVNGAPITIMPRTLLLKTNGAQVTPTFLGFSEDIVAGDVVTVQWKTDKGTLTMDEFNFKIDGMVEDRVIT